MPHTLGDKMVNKVKSKLKLFMRQNLGFSSARSFFLFQTRANTIRKRSFRKRSSYKTVLLDSSYKTDAAVEQSVIEGAVKQKTG